MKQLCKFLFIFFGLFLFIVVFSNNIFPRSFSGNLLYLTTTDAMNSGGDQNVIDTLTAWGFTIDVYAITDFRSGIPSDEEIYSNYNIIFFSEYCGSSDAARLRGATAGTWEGGWMAIPVVSTDNWFSKVGSLGFTDASSAGATNYGNVGPSGEVNGEAEVKIVDASGSVFSNGFNYGATILLVDGTDDSGGHLINFAVPKVDVIPIASLAGSMDQSQLNAYGVEKGTDVYNSAGELNVTTKARYASVGIMGGALNHMTVDAFKLLKGAFSWVLEGSTAVEHKDILPSKFVLEQNYPNPFNPSTQIKYSIPKESKVILEVFGMLGRKISTLVNETKLPGEYSVVFNASNFSSGVYIYRLTTGDQIAAKTMMLLK
jgi:hypothetical protein